MSEGQRTLWDVDGQYILKHQPSDRVIKVAQLLAAEDIPVAQYIPAVDGSFAVADGYSLMTKIKGTHIDLFEQPHLAAEFGRGLGRLHMALARIEPQLEDLSDNNFWNNGIIISCRGLGMKFLPICAAKSGQSLQRFAQCCPIN